MLQRGNAVCDAPASRDAGASLYEFPRRPWELVNRVGSISADVIFNSDSSCVANRLVMSAPNQHPAGSVLQIFLQVLIIVARLHRALGFPDNASAHL